MGLEAARSAWYDSDFPHNLRFLPAETSEPLVGDGCPLWFTLCPDAGGQGCI